MREGGVRGRETPADPHQVNTLARTCYAPPMQAQTTSGRAPMRTSCLKRRSSCTTGEQGMVVPCLFWVHMVMPFHLGARWTQYPGPGPLKLLSVRHSHHDTCLCACFLPVPSHATPCHATPVHVPMLPSCLQPPCRGKVYQAGEPIPCDLFDKHFGG